MTDAIVVQRLQAAGSVLVGKANLDEFAYNFTSETSMFGAGHNPWNPDCSPGGSSGGRLSSNHFSAHAPVSIAS